MKTKLLLTAAFAAALLSSCKKNNTTNPADVVYQMQTSGSDSMVIWSSGYASVNRLGFASGSSTHSYDANVREDLFNPVNIGTMPLPPASYPAAQYTISLAPANGFDALHLEGSFTYNGVSTPIFLEISSPIDIMAAQNMDAAAGASYKASIQINLANLLQGITPDQLTAATDMNGQIVLSASANSDLAGVVANNLKTTQLLVLARQ